MSCGYIIWVLVVISFIYMDKGNPFMLGPYPITDTNCGKVQGIWSQAEGGFSFRGIPYASPPTGSLRWRPPVGKKPDNNNCWSGTLSAQIFGSACAQRDESNRSNILGTEDCLYLNVITPTLNTTAKLPVLFWIHGGCLTFGSGNQYDLGYAPTVALAKRLNVVFVSINYRLNAFGFMALDWLKAGSPTNTSGNYGLMDMIEALHWVQDNIHNFGGDPNAGASQVNEIHIRLNEERETQLTLMKDARQIEWDRPKTSGSTTKFPFNQRRKKRMNGGAVTKNNNVTIFGQSSGGTAQIALLASPLSKGLFHKAWLSSASPVMNKTAADAFKDNEIFVRNTGCKDVNCLYDLTANEVIKSVPWDVYPFWSMDDLLGLPEKGEFDGAVPIVDGYVLQDAPFEVWANGNGIDVPVIIGTTAQETDQSPFPQDMVNWTWATSDYRDHVTAKLGTFSDLMATTALQLYPENVSTPEFQLTTMSTDLRMTCGNDYLAVILASGIKSPVYRYVATYYTKDKSATPFGNPFPVNYAYHGIDVFGFFGTMSYPLGAPSGHEDVLWENRMQREILSFVKNGKPETHEWKSYPGVTAELDTETRTFRGYHTAQCGFWLKNGLFSYSWIN